MVAVERTAGGDGLEVERVETGMTEPDASHRRYGRSWLGQSDLVGQLQQTEDRLLLLRPVELFERSRQMAASASDGGSTCTVEPVRSCVRLHPGHIEANKQLLDQQTIIEDDTLSRCHAVTGRRDRDR